jgi:D-tyrosyl-tRNA(Tyr) deacylase
MKLIIQYVSSAQVTVSNIRIGQIKAGYCVLVGFKIGDSNQQITSMAEKLLSLRTIPNPQGKINLSIKDIQGDILLIPQFTLYADTSRGHRPSFHLAAPPEKALKLFQAFVDKLQESGIQIETGKFGASMQVSLTNDGPITISLEN